MKIGIIGGGASGMCAALKASENPNAEILLFERQSRVGRKLLATGNGRCNITNATMDGVHYHGQDATFSSFALKQFSVEKTLQWFADLGLLTVKEASGRVYPYSDQANSVVDILRFALAKPNIQVLTGCEVSRIRKTELGFQVFTDADTYLCDKVIVACGGLAGTKLGGSMAGYKLLKSFGHSITRLRPSLVQVKSDWSGCVALKGVRANCNAQLCLDGQVLCQSTGELQFTEYGLSGPVIFEISRDACQTSGEWTCRLDFLPGFGETELLAELFRRKDRYASAEEILTGMLHNRLGRVLMSAAGIHGQRNGASLTEAELKEVCRLIKGLEVNITDTLGMDSAQVTAGGVVTDEFSTETMESALVSGLYACGEVLDVDGDCGGYNLQWAWSSGYLAGKCAGEVGK